MVLAFVKTWTRRLALVLALPVGGAVFFVLYVIVTVASYEQLDNNEKLASKNAYLAALPKAQVDHIQVAHQLGTAHGFGYALHNL